MIAPIYKAGSFTSADKIGTVSNSFDPKLISEYYIADLPQAEEAVEKALLAMQVYSKLASYERENILNAIADGISKKSKEFAETIVFETSKPLKYAQSEVHRAIYTFRVAAEETKRKPSESLSLDWAPHARDKKGLVEYFPCGVVLGITPFNFPLNLVAHKVAPALAAGCPIIIKPSPRTPLSALLLAEVIDSTELPKGMFSTLPLSNEDSMSFLQNEKIAMVSFTGSDVVGWQIKTLVGKKKVALELGGNAGVIVAESADINTAAQKCVSGAFAFSGQVCIHTQRIYVHEKNFVAFVKQLVPLAKNLKVGSPFLADTDVSVMIDEENAIRIESWVKEATDKGAKVLLGGKREGRFYSPTILTNVDSSCSVCCKEAFGPVVIVESYSAFSDAVKEINDSSFGLQAGVFTDSQTEVQYAFRHIETGAVIINDVPTFRVDHMPYGGIKNSGFGREGIRYAMMEMMEPKLLVWS